MMTPIKSIGIPNQGRETVIFGRTSISTYTVSKPLLDTTLFILKGEECQFRTLLGCSQIDLRVNAGALQFHPSPGVGNTTAGKFQARRETHKSQLWCEPDTV
jgi:hypothetical protein